MRLIPILSSTLLLLGRTLAQAQAPLGEATPSFEHSDDRETELLHLHRDLVNISSITGSESDVGEFIIHYLIKHGYAVHQQFIDPSEDYPQGHRFNVLAHFAESPKTRILLTSHMDTVPPFIPYSTSFKGGELWGRGVADAKGSIAAQIIALNELKREGKVGDSDVGLLFVSGEEDLGDGMQTANNLDLSWEAVVFGEPTENKLVSGHKGMRTFTLVTKGVAAHSGYPWLGVSANDLMVRALVAMRNAEDKLPSSKKFGNTTINVGQINGGVAPNVVAEEARAKVAIRIAKGEPDDILDSLVAEIKEALEPLPRGAGYGTIVDHEGYAPVHLDHDISGFGKPITVNYGTDVPKLKGKHKRYLYGPGAILVAHSDHEHVSVRALMDAVDGYKKIVMALLERET